MINMEPLGQPTRAKKSTKLTEVALPKCLLWSGAAKLGLASNYLMDVIMVGMVPWHTTAQDGSGFVQS